MTRSGRFYNDVAERGKEALTDGREVVESTENAEGDTVLKQLKKTRAQVSIWELLCTSQEHRQAMVEALNKIVVPEDANPAMLVGSVRGETLQRITFSEE